METSNKLSVLLTSAYGFGAINESISEKSLRSYYEITQHCMNLIVRNPEKPIILREMFTLQKSTEKHEKEVSRTIYKG